MCVCVCVQFIVNYLLLVFECVKHISKVKIINRLYSENSVLPMFHFAKISKSVHLHVRVCISIPAHTAVMEKTDIPFYSLLFAL